MIIVHRPVLYLPFVPSASSSACPEALPARFASQRASQSYLLLHTAYALAKCIYVDGSGLRCIVRPLWLLPLAAAAASSPRPLPSRSNLLLMEKRCAASGHAAVSGALGASKELLHPTAVGRLPHGAVLPLLLWARCGGCAHQHWTSYQASLRRTGGQVERTNQHCTCRGSSYLGTGVRPPASIR